jgi:hypothetical protein
LENLFTKPKLCGIIIPNTENRFAVPRGGAVWQDGAYDGTGNLFGTHQAAQEQPQDHKR